MVPYIELSQLHTKQVSQPLLSLQHIFNVIKKLGCFGMNVGEEKYESMVDNSLNNIINIKTEIKTPNFSSYAFVFVFVWGQPLAILIPD